MAVNKKILMDQLIELAKDCYSSDTNSCKISLETERGIVTFDIHIITELKEWGESDDDC